MKNFKTLAVLLIVLSTGCTPEEQCVCYKNTYQVKPLSEEKGMLISTEIVPQQEEVSRVFTIPMSYYDIECETY